MALGIYKRGQGYWTRQMTTIAGGVLILLGASWLSDIVGQFSWGDVPQLYVQASAGLLWTAVLGFILFHYVWSKQRSVDFLVATEVEMKKVNWSTRREVVGSTIVVILLSAAIALFCKVWDLVFVALFSSINVLETTT
jgi:preprotein translocase SecE subunit